MAPYLPLSSPVRAGSGPGKPKRESPLLGHANLLRTPTYHFLHGFLYSRVFGFYYISAFYWSNPCCRPRASCCTSALKFARRAQQALFCLQTSITTFHIEVSLTVRFGSIMFSIGRIFTAGVPLAHCWRGSANGGSIPASIAIG